MKPEPPEPEKSFSEDLKTFEQLPEKTQDLHLLTDQAERTTGRAGATLHRLIQKKSNLESTGSPETES